MTLPDTQPAVLPGLRLCQVQDYPAHGLPPKVRSDWLAEEVPIALVFNGISHAVMLASPLDLHDFALGFGLTEGLLAAPDELYGLDIQPVAQGIEMQIEVAAACARRLQERRRTLAGRTGCGLCGSDSLDQIRRSITPVRTQSVATSAILRAQHDLRAWQHLQQRTGATHAAAWCSLAGEVLLVREDVGRHNALDKVLGALARAGQDSKRGFICITSRASFEMVQKTALFGIAVLAAVSAPTALAVETAQQCNLALAGFVRQAGLVAYTFAERFQPGQASAEAT